MDSDNIGKRGENCALLYLNRLGFALVEANYHSRYGEIDLIVEDEHTIVFAEVKTRADRRFSSAAEAVDSKKIRKILLTAKTWLSENPSCSKQPRFDVVEVYPLADTGGERYARVNHIKNAFFAEE